MHFVFLGLLVMNENENENENNEKQKLTDSRTKCRTKIVRKNDAIQIVCATDGKVTK